MANRSLVLRLIRNELRSMGQNPFDTQGKELTPVLARLSEKYGWIKDWYESASKEELKALSNEYDEWRVRKLQ